MPPYSESGRNLLAEGTFESRLRTVQFSPRLAQVGLFLPFRPLEAADEEIEGVDAPTTVGILSSCR
jgi:hypothetical protein